VGKCKGYHQTPYNAHESHPQCLCKKFCLKLKRFGEDACLWLRPVILGTWEAEIRRIEIEIQDQFG
jgi:hypothetical protein